MTDRRAGDADFIARSDREYVVTRVFAAPRELVWRAWTEPTQMARWFGPRGFTNPRCELDVRPGGAWRIDMRAPDGTVYPNRGLYLEVVPPERLVWTDVVDEVNAPAWGDAPPPSAVNTARFEELGGTTRLTLTVRLATPAELAAMLDQGAVAGWTETLDRLAELLAGRRPVPPR